MMGNPAGDGGAGYVLLSNLTGEEMIELRAPGGAGGTAATVYAKVSSLPGSTYVPPTTATDQNATGNNQATAYQITTNNVIFTGVAAGTGAVLPAFTSANEGLWGYVVVANGQSNLLLYPAGAATINGGAPGGAVAIPAGSQGAVWVDSPSEIFVR